MVVDCDYESSDRNGLTVVSSSVQKAQLNVLLSIKNMLFVYICAIFNNFVELIKIDLTFLFTKRRTWSYELSHVDSN